MTTYKQPGEKIPLAVDFSKLLPSGETISPVGSDVKVYDSQGQDKTSQMLVAKTVSDTRIDAIIHGGASGQRYKVTFIAATQNYIFEEDVELEVREL